LVCFCYYKYDLKSNIVSKLSILSFNINGIRAMAKKGFLKWLAKEKPHILCVQETKVHDSNILDDELVEPEGYNSAWNCSVKKKGYSGVATYSRERPLKIQIDFGNNILSKEGRLLLSEYQKFYLLNIYFPNANHELTRLPYKEEFNKALLNYAKKLDKVKPVIMTGDFNVAHQEIDLARPKDNVGNPGFTDEERFWLSKFLKSGFIDIFRELHPQKIEYTWWSYRMGARQRNIGWRIDYFIISKRLKKYISKAYIMNEVKGSDHCPIGLELKF